MKLDLITVVFRNELRFLQTQARSVELRFQEKDVGKILILVNDTPDIVNQIELSWWGKLKDKVKIITRDDLKYTPNPRLKGWESQQVLKIIGCAYSTADWAIILDSKTWFIRDYKQEEFFDDDRANCNLMETSIAFVKGLYYVEELLGTEKTSMSIGPLGVPSFIKPKNARGLIEKIRQLTGQEFIDWFESNCNVNGVSEFATHSAYIISLGFEKFYTGKQSFFAFNLADFQVKEFDQWLHDLQQLPTWTVSIHRRAIPLLSEHQLSQWNKYLCSVGLY